MQGYWTTQCSGNGCSGIRKRDPARCRLNKGLDKGRQNTSINRHSAAPEQPDVGIRGCHFRWKSNPTVALSYSSSPSASPLFLWASTGATISPGPAGSLHQRCRGRATHVPCNCRGIRPSRKTSTSDAVKVRARAGAVANSMVRVRINRTR